jgi:Predicted membrane protein (DUF2157)
VISLEPELHASRDTLGERATTLLIERERREVLSLYPEIRLLAWGGAMLLATAAGIVLKDNYQRIGPIAVATLIGVIAAACYVWTWRRRTHASIADDSVLLLGALLVSADVAFVESQFHLLGDAWYRHFLIVAVVHGLAAYLYGSRALLSLSVVAVASWLGVEHTAFHTPDPTELSLRALGCVSVVVVWWKLNRRPDFAGTLEHFAAHFLLLSGFVRLFDPETRTAGCVLTIISAAMIMGWGFKTRRESFVLYAFVYAVIAADVLLLSNVRNEALIFLIVLISMIAAVATLLFIHARFGKLSGEETA